MCEHKLWGSVHDPVVVNILPCKGEVGLIDQFPLVTPVKPGPDTFCINCFQLFGKPDGSLFMTMVIFVEKLKELEESYRQHGLMS